MRSRYWSNTKFAKWIRGTNKPPAATWQGWETWRKRAKKLHPVRYWIAEEGLDYLQSFVNWPADKLHDIKYYINNRWVSRTHAMTSNLERGKWHEFETRLLHSMFDELVNFVETESAWHYTLWSEEKRLKYQTPWYAHGFWRCWRAWRCPEAGVDSLEWQSALVMDEGMGVYPGNPDYGKPTQQAIGAQEVLALYRWWTEDRPNRKDVYDVSGWTALHQDEDEKDIFSNTTSNAAAKKQSMDIMDTLEKRYDREDELMMIRLIKVRGNLWT